MDPSSIYLGVTRDGGLIVAIDQMGNTQYIEDDSPPAVPLALEHALLDRVAKVLAEGHIERMASCARQIPSNAGAPPEIALLNSRTRVAATLLGARKHGARAVVRDRMSIIEMTYRLGMIELAYLVQKPIVDFMATGSWDPRIDSVFAN